VRRCWRFGQEEPVDAYIVLSDAERAIYSNVKRKERQAEQMADRLIANVRQYEREELEGVKVGQFKYATDEETGDGWQMILGDSAECVKEIESESVGLSVFSPPFISVYTYSATERDLGNSRGEEEFFTHFRYIIDELLRVTLPGRICAVHVADIAATMVKHGFIGLIDFPGQVNKAFVDAGWIYHGRVTIDKNPQGQAIRTKARALLFVQLHKDSSASRPALADYILVFRKPGDSVEPVKTDIDNETWIEWASPVWLGIRESNTLQYTCARGDDDERHICPLQLEVIERCVRLWSNEGDLVLSPFAGIGSEGYMALKFGRRFCGVELKPEYYKIAVQNLRRAVEETKGLDLFAEVQCESSTK
jgi:DNA modification methylase